MAVGTEDLVKLTGRQNIITAIEASLLFLAVFFSAWASIAASRAAKAAEQATHSERAWVVFKEYHVDEMINSTVDQRFIKHGIRVYFTWENVGRSPAVNCFATIRHEFTGLDNAIPHFDVKVKRKSDVRPVVIGPNLSVFSQYVYLDNDDLLTLWDRKKRLIVYGRIIYNDVFTKNKERQTQICGEFSIHTDPNSKWNKDTFLHSFSPIGQQNTID